MEDLNSNEIHYNWVERLAVKTPDFSSHSGSLHNQVFLYLWIFFIDKMISWTPSVCYIGIIKMTLLLLLSSTQWKIVMSIVEMMSSSQKNENPIYVFCLSLIMYFREKKPAATTKTFFKYLHFGERKAVVKSVNGEICYFKNERAESCYKIWVRQKHPLWFISFLRSFVNDNNKQQNYDDSCWNYSRLWNLFSGTTDIIENTS